MPKSRDNITPKKNPAEEKLRATPFKSPERLKSEAEAIRFSVWQRFEEARVIKELLTKSEYKFVSDEWLAGLECFYGCSQQPESIYKIYSEGNGLKLKINKDLEKKLGKDNTKFLSAIIQSGIEGYGNLYMKTKGLLPTNNVGINANSVQNKAATKKGK